MRAIEQYEASEATYTATLRLVPPLAAEFTAYGAPPESVERARAWALDRRAQLVQGVPACPHAMYAMGMCPGRCHMHLERVDLWYAPGPDTRPEVFLLVHLYAESVPDELAALAKAHGLRVTVDEADAWYGFGRMTVRLSTLYTLGAWPVESRLRMLAGRVPVEWPPPVETP